MSFYSLDASAWVKRYFSEPGSAWILAAAIRLQRSFVDPTEQVIFVSADHKLLTAAAKKALRAVNPAQMPEVTAASS